MDIKRILRLGLLTFLVMSLIPTLVGFADVPTVVELELETRGEDTILMIQVRHSSPSGTHYVEVVEVELDGTVEEIKLESQSSTTFSVEHSVDSNVTDIRVRAHCTNHGWSQWKRVETEEPTNGGGSIPGFPIESIIIGLALSAMVLWIISQR